MSLTKVSYSMIQGSPVNVLDYGADPTGVEDSTAAFNLATLATLPSTGNDQLEMRRDIYVPAGDYKITGTVYVRKGQRLRGGGEGTSRIVLPTVGTVTEFFKMGYGLINGVEVYDTGGQSCVITDLCMVGGIGGSANISCYASGAHITNVFMSAAGIGILMECADTIVSDCTFDLGQIAIQMSNSNQNNLIQQCIFYNLNYGIVVDSNTFDIQVADCHFEYQKYEDVSFVLNATNIKNFTITDCQFVKNTQYATSDYAIAVRSDAAQIEIRECEFRNQHGYSIGNPNQTANSIKVSGCIFDGEKSNPLYAQSTTASGIEAKNSNWEITNCTFKNLYGPPVSLSGSGNYLTTIKDCKYYDCIGVSSFVVITASAGTLNIYHTTGDDVLPLINTQSVVDVRLNNNIRWLGAAQTASSRYYWKIPTLGAANVTVGVVANPNPGGSLNYRKASTIIATRYIDYNGSTTTDYATEYTVYASPAGVAGALDIQVDLDSVGGGSSAAYTAQGRNLVVSIPNTYESIKIEADYSV